MEPMPSRVEREEAIGQLIKIMSATESSREALVRKERRRPTSGWRKRWRGWWRVESRGEEERETGEEEVEDGKEEGEGAHRLDETFDTSKPLPTIPKIRNLAVNLARRGFRISCPRVSGRGQGGA